MSAVWWQGDQGNLSINQHQTLLIIALLIDHNIHHDNISQPFSQNFDHKQRMFAGAQQYFYTP